MVEVRSRTSLGRRFIMAEQDRSSTAEACPDCRALVSDLEAHERWHSRLVSDLAKAVEQEIKRSTGASA
jgi:hypothetical protein